MIIKTNFVFVFKEEAVVFYSVDTNSKNMRQYFNINSYCNYKRKSLSRFIKVIIQSKKNEYDNINDIYEIVTRLGLCLHSSYCPHKNAIIESNKYLKNYKKLYRQDKITC